MSLTIANVGGTMTGGASVALTYAGSPVSGKVTFVAPSHTRLAPREVSLTASPANTTPSDPGVARAALKVTFGDRETQEGCCNVQAGHVIIDVGVRWSLNQPEALADDAIEMVQALVFSAAFIDAVKKGILPQ